MNVFLRCSEFAIIIILVCQAQVHPLRIFRTRILYSRSFHLQGKGCRKMQRMWQVRVGEFVLTTPESQALDWPIQFGRNIFPF